MLTGKVSTGVLSVITFIVMAKILTVQEIGSFSFFLSISAMVSVAANWGLNEYILKQGTSTPDEIGNFVHASRLLKGIIGIGIGILVGVYLSLHSPNLIYVLTFLFVLMSVLVDSQTVSIVMAFRTKGSTRFEALLYPTRSLARLLLVLVVSEIARSLLLIVAGLFLINVLWLSLANRYYLSAGFSRQTVKLTAAYLFGIAKKASPFVLVTLIGITYTKADHIMLGMMKGEHEIGIYAVAWQLYETALFLPVSLQLVLLPRFVKLFEATDQWLIKSNDCFKLSLALGASMGILLFFLAPYPVYVIFGNKYAESTNIMKILMIAYIFRFVWTCLISTALISSNNMNVLNRILIFSLFLNIGVNAYCIPHYGPVGAAYSTVISDFFAFILGAVWLLRFRFDVKNALVIE